MTDGSTPTDLSTLDGRRGSTRIELSDDGSSYTCVRTFGAPPERVFRAFTDPTTFGCGSRRAPLPAPRCRSTNPTPSRVAATTT
jgi:hypothetical protein